MFYLSMIRATEQGSSVLDAYFTAEMSKQFEKNVQKM